MNFLLQKIKFKKLANSFQFVRLTSGSSIIVIRYNEFFEKSDPFGIKLNTFNTKKLREGRSGITFLRMLRRSARDAYYKFTKNTEAQFNLLKNEHTDRVGHFLIKNQSPRFLIKELQLGGFENYFLTGFQGSIYRRLSNFHLYTLKLYKVKGWINQSFSIKGFRNSFFTHFQIRSKPYHNRLIAFGKVV
jgi:hypothetical protein